MKPRVPNCVCAHPVILSWMLGAVATNVAVLIAFTGSFPFTDFPDARTALRLLCGFASMTLLGYFLGMFICWPWVRIVCSQCNGSPLRIGDQVQILTSSHRGSLVSGHELTKNQGGWDLARLTSGENHRSNFTDIFEEYSVLRLNSRPEVS